jgi:hypothetical protein
MIPPDLASQQVVDGPGLYRPCRGRPILSLIAEDRSADGVRNQTGPEAPMLTRLLTGRAVMPWDERVQDGTTLRHPPSSRGRWSLGEHRPVHRVGSPGPGVPDVGFESPARTSPDRHDDVTCGGISGPQGPGDSPCRWEAGPAW